MEHTVNIPVLYSCVFISGVINTDQEKAQNGMEEQEGKAYVVNL